jgi:superfamily II DNA or RNA helicase
MPTDSENTPVFQDRKWLYTYKTSSLGPDGQPVNILHDFYIPVLKLSVKYDRVAGYFRSSSLAVASQGFSAFSTACGRVRMIVGADLDPHDVEAILQGDKKCMAEHLNRELEGLETWPEDVRQGVELLSWMVSRGCLEVRVAFRVHRQTGKPLSFDSCEDGYVHEKWAIFTDAVGSRIYMSGSLNESRQALVYNAENINLHTDWWGNSDQQRINEAATSFEQLWNNDNPHIKVLTLPEAVSRRLVRIAENVAHPFEIDGSSAMTPEIEAPCAMERLRFALIKDGPRLPGGRYVGMETAPVKPWPHQQVVARRLISTWPYNYLLCDEVGLGKTIEAGLAIRSLYLSGIVKRVLVAPPASLTQQWQREMGSKFFLPFALVKGGSNLKHDYIFPFEKTRSGSRMYDPDLCIVSTGLLSRTQRLEELQNSMPFDLALVDEAHYARRKTPGNGERTYPQFGQLFKAIRDRLIPRTKSLWMATATPMQLDWIEVFDLIYLTRRVAHFQKDPTLTWAYYNALGKLVRDRQIDTHQWDLLRQAVSSVEHYDPFLWSFFHNAVIDGRIRAVSGQWLDHNRIPRGSDLKNMQRLIFAAAPLSRVMLRHTRSLLEIYRSNGQLGENLAKREILAMPRIVLSGVDKTADDNLEAYCKDLTKQIEANSNDNKWKTSLGFYLSFLRLRLASSTFALRETLKRRKERVALTRACMQITDDPVSDLETEDHVFGDSEDIDEKVIETLLKNRTPADLQWEETRLTGMLEPLKDLTEMPLKMKELLGVLQKWRLSGSRIKQTVIFTRFYDTLTDIVKRLRGIDPAMLIGTYSGKGGQYVEPGKSRLRGVDREEIKHRFIRGDIDILVCTDAAAEGLNLQTADLIINYDLPWNPMKVEQRIGRIDRIGQTHPGVYVLNLCYVDSAEQIVYDRLLKRLAQAGDVVGIQQISMLPVTEEEFAELAAGTLKEQTLFKRAQQRIKEQRQRTESMEIPASQLYDIYIRLKGRQEKTPPPVTLDNIWHTLTTSKYLRDLGAAILTDHPVLNLRGIDNVSDNTPITISRSIYEKGISVIERPIHFASYGDIVFGRVLGLYQKFDLPECVIRMTEEVPDINITVVAYAAACINKNGESEVKLITSFSDTLDIVLDEQWSLSETELSAARQMLHEMIRFEFDPTRSIDRLIGNNERAGRAHAILNLLIADSLFPNINTTEEDNFGQSVKDIDKIIAERDQLAVSKLPVPLLEKIKHDLLFDIYVPQTVDTTTLTLPIILIKSAVDCACRIADSLKERRSNLTIGKVKIRIKREISRYLKVV